VEVGKALIYTCLATEKLGLPLVVKAHPKRPDLMKGLYLSIQKFKHMTWVSKVSVHQLIEKSRCVVTVNSGAGMEALFHKKPVITFGSAEYDCVTIPATKDTIEQAILEAGYDEERVIKFFDSWYRWCYDVSDSSTFTKLP
jgi:capsule polysaccharide modification protein KpsS